LGTARSLTKNVGLCHFVTTLQVVDATPAKVAETLDIAKSSGMRLSGADQRRDRGGDYSRCTLIKTRPARTTPIASMPTAICPSIMLASVQATVADPISIGIEAAPS
jgi:hypothetical protein